MYKDNSSGRSGTQTSAPPQPTLAEEAATTTINTTTTTVATSTTTSTSTIAEREAAGAVLEESITITAPSPTPSTSSSPASNAAAAAEQLTTLPQSAAPSPLTTAPLPAVFASTLCDIDDLETPPAAVVAHPTITASASCPPSEANSSSDNDSEYESATHRSPRPSTTSTTSTSSTAHSTSSTSSSASSAVAVHIAGGAASAAAAAAAAHRKRRAAAAGAGGAKHCEVNADVRLLRKIGYIASRVRFLAKIYGDFKLVNPYTPAKQRRQLQEILLKHALNDPTREPYKSAAAAAILAVAAGSVSNSLSASQASSCLCLPTDSSTTYDDETVITTAAGTVRRTSATSLTATASTRLLEDLLVQFYEDRRRQKLTVIKRRRSSGGGGAGAAGGRAGGSGSNATSPLAGRSPTQRPVSRNASTSSTTTSTQLIIMSGELEEQQQRGRRTPEVSGTGGVGGGLKRASIDFVVAKVGANNNVSAHSSQQQHQQQRSNSLLQPIPHMDNLRRRRASDCSAHMQQQQANALTNQLQVTLKNNNCAKFPFHRGSCGAAGEHLLAANSIANRSTIILSKSCSHVDAGTGVGSVASAAGSAAALYGSSDLRHFAASLTGGSGGTPASRATTTTTTANTNGNGNGNNGNEYSIVQLNNTIIQCQFNDEDFRALVRELRRKVEYTERMNWLCLSKRPLGPPNRKSSLPKHQEVKRRFLEICDTTFSDEVKAALRLPAFDSYEWHDADVIHLMQTMFIELGFLDKFDIPVETLREWLYEVYKHYNEVPFHNFRHCFCVAQMMYAITQRVSLLERIGDLECLILLVSCICHDLDHPGYNNIYQINARTELALRYNDISPLENHHCSIAFRLLEHPECNIFKNFSRDQFNQIREGIIRCILATDMARHNEILTQFKDVRGDFDYSNRSHLNLLCMVLIKVADISNEARPMEVAEPWLDRLLQEFFAQSAAEKSEGLPVTPFMDPDKVSKPGSQVRFIGLVLLPLFEALGELLPELTELIIIPVRVALDYYKRLNDAQTRSRKSVAESSASAEHSGADSNAASTATSTPGSGTTTTTTSGTTMGQGGSGNTPGSSGTNGTLGSGGGGGGGGGGTSSGGSGGSSGGGGGGGSGGPGAGGGGANSGGSISPQMPRSQSGISVKSRRSIPSQKSASRTSVDEPTCMAAELHDLPEGSESGDSETATEVDVAEKTSKFKVDTEGSSNRSKSSHSTSRKSSREKRPSMIGEMCSSGQRIRNSYGNIHGHHTNRNHFGSNRAVSLDQYSTNNRRLSDGLQQVISDSNVFYNHHNRSSLGTSSSTTGSGRLIEDMNMNTTGFVPAQVANVASSAATADGSGEGSVLSGTNGGSGSTGTVQYNVGGGGAGMGGSAQQQPSASNGNLSPTAAQAHQALSAKQQQFYATGAPHHNSNGLGGGGGGNNGGGGSNGHSAKPSWKARLKQFSDYFSFSFDKSGKRFGSTRSSPGSGRNNNGDGAQLIAGAPGPAGGVGRGGPAGVGGGGMIDPLTGKPSVCCTISNSLQSPGLMRQKHPSLTGATHQELINAGRNRAYSLDVPCSRSNPRYSSSSCGGGDSSRKSSRHDGTATGDENNSNNTLHSSGGVGGEMPTCLPPPIRIGSVDASDTILITASGLPRVITPANLGGGGGGSAGSGGIGGVGGGGIDLEPSLSIDLGMNSGTSSSDPPKI